MNYFRGISLILSTVIVVLAFSFIGFSSCTNNTDNTLLTPEFEEPEAPPMEVTIDQLCADYTADAAAADTKYRGGRLLFYDVEVQQVVGGYYQMSPALGADSLQYVKLYFTNGLVKFKPQDFGIMQNIEEGYVLNVVGECIGLNQGFIYIEDCWVESVVGDIGTGGYVDYY